MIEPVRFLLIGLGIGAIYAIIAQGVVVIFRGSGILNLAHGAFVMVGAYAYYELVVTHGFPALVAIPASMAIGAVTGVLSQLIILRPMQRASPVSRVVATLGLLITLQSIAVLRYGVDVKAVPSALPTDRVELIEGAPIGLDRLLLLGMGTFTTLILWVVYRSTRFGRVTTAVAENRRAAATLGHSPDLVAAVNWAIGGALAALAGCLIAPITFLQPTTLSLLIIPALAAGLLAGFASFPIALASSLAIGITESLMGRYVHRQGWATSVPFVIVIVIVVLRGRGLPLRSHVIDRFPAVGSGRVRTLPTLTMFALLITLLIVAPVRWVDAISVTMIFVILCMSVVAVTGFAGQLALSQYVIAGVGALSAARLSASWGWPFPLAIVGAVAASMALGTIVALPALRTRGLNLAIVTFGMATVIFSLLLNNARYTGGDTGIAVDPPSILGWSIDAIRYPERYAVVVVCLVFVCGLALCNIRRGAVGLRLLAVRSNERAAAAVGVNVPAAKLYAFVLASALAALGGVLLSFRSTNVIAGSFSVFPSINIVAMTVVGGVGSVGGAVMGATLLQGGVGSELLRNFHGIERYVPLAGGIILLHILRTNRNGLFAGNVHIAQQVIRRTRALLGRGRAVDEPVMIRPASATSANGVARPRVLRVEGLTVAFGGVVAVSGFSLDVRPGEVHGLIGPNGAGKTTVIDAITGFVTARTGRILLDDDDIGTWSPPRRCRSGVSRSFQSLELFDDLTVSENMAVAADAGRWTKFLTDLVRPGRVGISAEALAGLYDLGLESAANAMPGSLPYGQRRLVSIARALASGPSLVLLDEPASGLDDAAIDQLAGFIRHLANTRGIGVLLVEHNLDLVMAICDRITVIAAGSVLATGKAHEIRTNPAVLAAFVGPGGDLKDADSDATTTSAMS